MKYQLCDFHDSTSEMLRHLHLKLALPNIKMDSKTHVNNLNLKFFFTQRDIK